MKAILNEYRQELVDNLRSISNKRSDLAAEDMKRASEMACLQTKLKKVEDALSKLQDSD